MKSNALNMVLIFINVILALAIVFFGAYYLLKDESTTQDNISKIQKLQEIKPAEKNLASDGRNKQAMLISFLGPFTNSLRNKAVTPDNPTETVKLDDRPKIAPLDSLLEIKGISWRDEFDCDIMIMLVLADKQHLLEIGEQVPGLLPKAKFIRSPNDSTFIFMYNDEETTLILDNEIGDVASPILDDDSGIGIKVNGSQNGNQESPPDQGSDTNPEINLPDQSPFDESLTTFDEQSGIWKISENEFNWFLNNIESEKKALSFAPSKNKGKVDGIKIARIEENSLAYKRGFRKKDVIISVNGKKVANANELYALQNDPDIQNADTIIVKYRRNGKIQSFTFTRNE